MMVKDHMYRVPIMDIKYHRSPLSSSPLILSTDQKILKIWHPDTGRNFANIEPGMRAHTFLTWIGTSCADVSATITPRRVGVERRVRD